MIQTEAHRYTLPKDVEDRRAPSMVSIHGRNNSVQYGSEVTLETVATILEDTQPDALTGGRGSIGYEQTRQHYETFRRGGGHSSGRDYFEADIRYGRYTVASAMHHAVGVVKSQPSSHAEITLPFPDVPRAEAAAVWLSTIAVLPKARGNGIASALLHDVLGNYPNEARVITEVAGPFRDNPIAAWLEDRLDFQLERRTTGLEAGASVGVSLFIAESVGVVRSLLEGSGKIVAMPQPIEASRS